MAQDDDTPRKKKGTSLAVWVLLILLIAGLGGFGVSNFGGQIQSIGKVGARDIDVDTYARALRQELNAVSQQFGVPVTLAQAQAFGLDQQVLQSVVSQTALDNEADRIGLSVGDAVVASEVTTMPAFQSASGSFDRSTYGRTLEQNNLTESEFEATVRADLSRSLLQGAVVGGFVAPDTLTQTLWAYVAEQRGFSLLVLTEADLAAPLAAPTEADLAAHYTANLPAYTRAEAKRISYAALLPETLVPTMPVDEADVTAAYQARIGEFMVPERRLVERLVYPSDADAQAAKARLDGGEAFETLVADRGLTLTDIDLGDVSQGDLGAAGEAVFALPGPGVVGPLPSDLGPALFRMNAVLAAQETTLEEARPGLVAALQTAAAARAIGDRVEAVDDLLAGGAALEDLVRDEGFVLSQTDYVAGDARNADIAADAAFATAADAVVEGDFPEAILLRNGGVAVLRLDQIVPPTPLPLDEVRDQVAQAWRDAALAARLSARAIEIKTAIEAGATLESQGTLQVIPAMDRQATPPGAPRDVVQAAFQMMPGDLRVIELPGFTALLRLDSVAPANAENAEAMAMREAVQADLNRALAQDAFTLFTSRLGEEAGITLDQAAINAVHASFN